MNIFQIILLGLIQGAAELLPVSSSAHVIVAEKLMGLDPSSPEMTFLLVMLHTGTMLAVIVYFWKSWKQSYFSSTTTFQNTLVQIFVATLITGILGKGLQMVIERILLHGGSKAEVELLFGQLPIIWAGLVAAGLLILYSGIHEEKNHGQEEITPLTAAIIGAVQALCLPFRGFSRSGSTISTGLILGISKRKIEEFSFALGVVITPPLVLMELHRLMKTHPEIKDSSEVIHLALPGLFGMVCSFIAGLLALRVLSQWLEAGKWKFFGYYCLAASLVVFILWKTGLGSA